MTGEDPTLLVGLPEPVGRRARLGPFPSGVEAVKFASYAGVGAVVAGATTALLWLPFLAAGLLVSLVRHDGKGIDARVADYVRYRLRAGSPRGSADSAGGGNVQGAVAAGPGGRRLAVLETGGVPIAFLPRREAQALFEAYRQLLRAVGGGLYLSAEARPEPAPTAGPAPVGPDRPRADRPAFEAYRELLRLLARHRRRRVVRLVVWSEPNDSGGLAELEERVDLLTGRLMAMGLSPVRLRDRALGEVLEGFGWRPAG